MRWSRFLASSLFDAILPGVKCGAGGGAGKPMGVVTDCPSPVSPLPMGEALTSWLDDDELPPSCAGPTTSVSDTAAIDRRNSSSSSAKTSSSGSVVKLETAAGW